MQLTIFFKSSKCKQVIHMSDKFAVTDNNGYVSNHLTSQKARELAMAIAANDYLHHSFVGNY